MMIGFSVYEMDLTEVAFRKWIHGEDLGAKDVERIINVFDTIPLNLEVNDQARMATLQVRLRSVLHERFMPKG